MKSALVLSLLLCSFVSLAQSVSTPIAIVELFTSQGCSSCPSADQLLRDAVNARSELGEVYGLSFHVSYWDRLGWKDPYSSVQYTERQKWYAHKMRLTRIYTPQMVVDGRHEFVGSQRAIFKESIKSSFSNNVKERIALNKPEISADQLSISYHYVGNLNNMVINVALVQKIATNRVPRGENRHKTLTHANVVRVFKTIPLAKTATVVLELPELASEDQFEVIAYAQNTNTLLISAVGKTGL